MYWMILLYTQPYSLTSSRILFWTNDNPSLVRVKCLWVKIYDTTMLFDHMYIIVNSFSDSIFEAMKEFLNQEFFSSRIITDLS